MFTLNSMFALSEAHQSFWNMRMQHLESRLLQFA